MTEHEIEDLVRQSLESAGLLTERLAPEGRRGWPDFCVLREGCVVFVETKRPGGGLSAQQLDCIETLEDYGMNVVVGDDVEQIVNEVCDIFAEWGVL